jgi:hypothetical protein
MSARSALGNFQLCGRSNFRLGLQMDADFRGDSQPEKEFSCGSPLYPLIVLYIVEDYCG